VFQGDDLHSSSWPMTTGPSANQLTPNNNNIDLTVWLWRFNEMKYVKWLTLDKWHFANVGGVNNQCTRCWFEAQEGFIYLECLLISWTISVIWLPIWSHGDVCTWCFVLDPMVELMCGSFLYLLLHWA
jgi:hypothetical protein